MEETKVKEIKKEEWHPFNGHSVNDRVGGLLFCRACRHCNVAAWFEHVDCPTAAEWYKER